MTFNDLLEKLKKEDELTVLEILDVNCPELIEYLENEIYDRQDRVRSYYGEDEENPHGEEESD